MSQNTSCAPFTSSVSANFLTIWSAQAFILESLRDSLRRSLVRTSILSEWSGSFFISSIRFGTTSLMYLVIAGSALIVTTVFLSFFRLGILRSKSSFVLTSATLRNILMRSAMLMKFLTLFTLRNPSPEGLRSMPLPISAKVRIQLSKRSKFFSLSPCISIQRSMVYISAIVLDIGVPVANTTPLPPNVRVSHCVLANISLERLASELARPDTLSIDVAQCRFLNKSASSTNIWSMPSCSNGIPISSRLVLRILSMRFCRLSIWSSNIDNARLPNSSPLAALASLLVRLRI